MESAKRSQVLNPIRNLLEKEFKVNQSHAKPIVNLTLGEPTVQNGYPSPPVISESVIEVIKSQSHNGYTASQGHPDARQAVVDKYSNDIAPFPKENVILTFGASGGLYTSLCAICEEGDNILMPKPSFPLCKTICENLNVEVRFYDLDPDKGFEMMIETAEALVDEKTKVLLIINPSNPCGSCFSKEHLTEIADFARKHSLTVLADEIYHGLAYEEGSHFYPFAEVALDIPVIKVGGISKIYGVPGWRLGWIIVYNRHGFLTDILDGMLRVTTIWLHPCSLIQFALP